MRSSETPELADWFAILLRWLALIGLMTSLALSRPYSIVEGIALFLLALVNTLLSVMAVFHWRASGQSVAVVGLDAVAALVLFVFSGGVSGPLAWAGLLPIFSAAIYFGWGGSLAVAILFTLIVAGIALATVPWWAGALSIAFVSGVNLIFGLAFGLIAPGLITAARAHSEAKVEETKPIERKTQDQAHERMQVLYNLMATLSATLNYQVVLDTALDLSVQAITDASNSTDRVVSAVMLYGEQGLEVGSARRFTPADQRVSLPGKQGAIGQALSTGEPVLCSNPAEDPELERIVALRSCRSTYILPLLIGLNAYGVLLFAHPDADFFTSERREVLDVIGHQAVLAIQNARLYQDLEQEKERMIEAQEEARKKLARDLHDGPTQSVAAIAMRVNFVRHMLERDPKAAFAELAKIEELAFRTNKEIRHMLFTLRPLTLESQGLVPALEAMAEKMRETYSQNMLVEADPAAVKALEINKQTVIFYIVEEAVNNARKHANAEQIWVRLHFVPQEKDLILLEIQDDGAGFDVDAITSSYEGRGSLGMVNLRERSELVNGLLNLESAPGRGTRVQVFIPLTDEVADRLHRVH